MGARGNSWTLLYVIQTKLSPAFGQIFYTLWTFNIYVVAMNTLVRLLVQLCHKIVQYRRVTGLGMRYIFLLYHNLLRLGSRSIKMQCSSTSVQEIIVANYRVKQTRVVYCVLIIWSPYQSLFNIHRLMIIIIVVDFN